MRYNNRLFPHPVLGIQDDINGEFTADLTYRSDKDNITISIIYKLTEDNLIKLISEEKAAYVVQLYCRGTIFREIFEHKSTIAEIVIPAIKLNGPVETDFFICSKERIATYQSKAFNPDYQNTSFYLDATDILAYGGKGKFVANKSPEELKSISSLIRIKNSEKKRKPMYNEYEGHKIEIMLCEEDYENYQSVVQTKILSNLIHSSVVLPALIDALYFIENSESSQDYHDRRWYKALFDIKSQSKTSDNFQIAQNILDMPVDRTFNSMLNLLFE